MPDETSPSPATPSRPFRRINQLLFILIPILALTRFGYPHLIRFLAAPYVVTAGKVRYYPERPWGMWPGPLNVGVTVACNRRQPIPFCEMVVDSISDDAGNDLLGGPLLVMPSSTRGSLWSLSYRGKEEGTSISGGGSTWPASAEIHEFTWNVEVPRLPRSDIKSLHLTGHIELWEGGEQHQLRIPGVDFKAGTTFQIDGRTAEIVEFMEADNGNTHGTCVVKMRDDGLFLLRAECEASGRTEMESKPRGKSLPQSSGESPKEFFFSFSTPSGATRGDVTFHYRTHATRQTLPVDLQYPVAPSKDDSAFGEDTMLSRRRTDDQDWGTPLPVDRYPATQVHIGTAKLDMDPRYPETSIPITIQAESNSHPIASDIRIDRLHDGAGYDFLAVAPWRSSDYLPVSLYPSRLWKEPDKSHYRLEVWSTGKVQGSGIYRLAFGSDETTVTVPAVAPVPRSLLILAPKSDHPATDGRTPIDLGVVRLLPQRTLSDSIEFKVEGNIGLIREITALDENGTVIGSETPGIHPFFSRKDWLYASTGEKPDRLRQWKITYFRKSSWMERPFEFSSDAPSQGQ